MAKVPQTKTEETKALVPAAAQGGPPAALAEEMARYAGAGVSTKAEDNLIPLLYVLQKGSPQVNARDPLYVEGAVAGSLFLKATGQLWSGEAGILYQPCAFSRIWNAWLPRGSGGGGGAGFRGSYPQVPEGAKETPDPSKPKGRPVLMYNDTQLIDTRQHVGNIFTEDGRVIPALIALSSSGHSVSRQWMTLMNQFKTPGGQPYPSFSHKYRITTIWRQNNDGDWFLPKIEDAGWVDNQQWEAGKALSAAFEAGDKIAETPSDDPHAAEKEIPF